MALFNTIFFFPSNAQFSRLYDVIPTSDAFLSIFQMESQRQWQRYPII